MTNFLTTVAVMHQVHETIELVEQLRRENQTLTYKEFGEYVGLVGAEGWLPCHRQQTEHLLNAAYAVCAIASTKDLALADFKAHIINARTGVSGLTKAA